MTHVAIVHNIPIAYKHLLFTELARQGVQFEVVFLASTSRDRMEVPDLSIAPYQSRVGYHGHYELMPCWRTVSYVWRALSELQPGVVIISGWSDVGAWAAKLWCVCHGRAHILWSESNSFDHRRWFGRELVKALFIRGFSAAQVYGMSSREYLCQLGMRDDRIWSKRAVADTELFRPFERRGPRSQSRKIILFVGRLAPEKNLEFVLKTIRQLSFEARDALLFRLVGYGPLEGSLRAMANRFGLKNLLEFAGSRKHSELPEVYHSADVLLLPSSSETWGLTVNEGMLCGLPAIVSRRCGCERDLVHPGTGWSFDPRDSAGLRRILEVVAAMPLKDIRAMGRDAAAVAREYSAKNCARIVCECISAVESHRRPAFGSRVEGAQDHTP